MNSHPKYTNSFMAWFIDAYILQVLFTPIHEFEFF